VTISAHAVSRDFSVARSGATPYDQQIAGKRISSGFNERNEGGGPLEVDETKKKIREILSVRMNLSTAVDTIDDDTPLFGPGSLGLDSIDALELVLGLQKVFGVIIEDRALAVKVLVSIDTIAEYVNTRSAGNPGAAGGIKA
jgi:acyl carrier protein